MAENTKIQWCDHTFNGWVGCTKVNEGCKFCYAENLMDARYGRVQWGPQGTRSRTKTWHDPIRWDRGARRAGVERKVFCSSLCDVFEDWRGPITDSKGREIPGLSMNGMRRDLFKMIDKTPNLHWLLLTKRPENILDMWPDSKPRENVWLGTSIANQSNADEYVPRLLEVKNLCRFVFLSVEPQIGPVDLSPWISQLDWVIIGGESQQGKELPRPFRVQWARYLVRQCREANVPCFVKQLGSNAWDGPRKLDLKDSHGGDMAEWEPGLRVRECPESITQIAW